MISIVTIVYNDFINVEKTILSVLNQTYEDVQYIVIDGASTDKTLTLVEKYKDKIDVIVSEPDNGIYDALNKSLDYVKGDWVVFMNSGDFFYSNNVLMNIFAHSNFDNIDVVYGNVSIGDKGDIVKPRSLNLFWKGLPFNHQCSFTRASILFEEKFDLTYSISSVHDFFYKLYLNKYNFKYVNEVVAVYDLTGVSATSSLWLWDNFRINLKFSKKKMHLVLGALILHSLSKVKKYLFRKI